MVMADFVTLWCLMFHCFMMFDVSLLVGDDAGEYGEHYQCYGVWGHCKGEIAQDGLRLLCVWRWGPVDSPGKPQRLL